MDDNGSPQLSLFSCSQQCLPLSNSSVSSWHLFLRPFAHTSQVVYLLLSSAPLAFNEQNFSKLIFKDFSLLSPTIPSPITNIKQENVNTQFYRITPTHPHPTTPHPTPPHQTKRNKKFQVSICKAKTLFTFCNYSSTSLKFLV